MHIHINIDSGERVAFDRNGLTISSIDGFTLLVLSEYPAKTRDGMMKKTYEYHGHVTNNMVNNHGHNLPSQENGYQFAND